jgi:hypothetical protein
MMKKLKTIALISAIIFTLGLVGCRTAPVYNVESSPIEVSPETSWQDVKKAIVSAGASLGWQMKEVETGHIVGKLFIRDHMAAVDIKSTRSAYSITYKDSSELKYDGVKIHKNYNSWIQNLDRAIQARLSGL